MKIRRYIFMFSLIVSIAIVLMMPGLLSLSLKMNQQFHGEYYTSEINGRGLDSLKDQAQLVFNYVEHLQKNTEMSRSELIDTIELLSEPLDDIWISDLQSKAYNSLDTGIWSDPHHKSLLVTEIRQNLTNNRYSFRYPDRQLNLNENGPQWVYFFQIFPEKELVIGIGSNFRLSYLRFQFYSQKVTQFSYKMLGLTILLAVGSALIFSLILNQRFRKKLIKPLLKLEAGLRILPDHNSVQNLDLKGFSELESISKSYTAASIILRQNHQDLIAKEKQYRTLIEHIPQKIFLKDIHSRYLSCNKAFANDLGIEPDEIRGKIDQDFYSDEMAQMFRDEDFKILTEGKAVTLIKEDTMSERHRWIQKTKAPVFDPVGNPIGLLAIFFDITELKEKEVEIQQWNKELEERVTQRTEELEKAYKEVELLSERDPLTELYNRRKFQALADQCLRENIRRKEPMGIIMLDIDYFKKFNDRYGHQKGDEALKIVASCISEALSRPGDVAARYGGEEFILLLPNTDNRGLLHVTDRISFALEKYNIPHEDGVLEKKLTLSAGIFSQIPKDEKDLPQMIKKADIALYEAKNLGRNRCEIFYDMD